MRFIISSIVLIAFDATKIRRIKRALCRFSTCEFFRAKRIFHLSLVSQLEPSGTNCELIAKRSFSFVGITYYVSKTWQNGCRQRKKVAWREKIR
jgi:hypothetical protein